MAKRSTREKASAAIIDAQTRILVLHGPDEMAKRQYLEKLSQAMKQVHGDTETFTFDGRTGGTGELAQILDELRSYGLMQQYKIVIVDQADQFVTRHRDALTRYAQSPVDHGTLVLRSTRWNKGNLDKAIAKVGALIKCEPPTPANAVTWLIDRAREKYQCELRRPIAQLLVDRLTPDLMRLDAELGKLVVMVDQDQPISRELVDQVVGRSSDEQAWMVQDAVLAALTSKQSKSRTAGGDAIIKLHELVDLSGQADVLVAYFIADLIRKLYIATILLRQHVDERSIASQLKLWGPRQAQVMGLARRLSPASVGQLFDQIVQMDMRSKSGFGNAMRNIECFCADLADKLK